MMYPPLSDTTRKFWEQVIECKRQGYSYWLVTSLAIRPELIAKSYHFCRVPCVEYDIAVWGFKSIEKSAQFKEAYNAEDWK